MKHVARAVHALMQDADAHDLLLNLYSRCLHVLPATLCQPLRRDDKSISKAP
jgi:hypothetical protein